MKSIVRFDLFRDIGHLFGQIGQDIAQRHLQYFDLEQMHLITAKVSFE